MVCGGAQAEVTWSDLAHSEASTCATVTVDTALFFCYKDLHTTL